MVLFLFLLTSISLQASDDILSQCKITNLYYKKTDDTEIYTADSTYQGRRTVVITALRYSTGPQAGQISCSGKFSSNNETYTKIMTQAWFHKLADLSKQSLFCFIPKPETQPQKQLKEWLKTLEARKEQKSQ